MQTLWDYHCNKLRKCFGLAKKQKRYHERTPRRETKAQGAISVTQLSTKSATNGDKSHFLKKVGHYNRRAT